MSIHNMMFNGLSGVNSMSANMGVLADNIANINTVGHKSSYSLFQNVLTSVSSQYGDIGNGGQVAAINKSFQPGQLEGTSNATDMAIDGRGFFMLRDSLEDEILYTRDGQLRIDEQADSPAGTYFLVTPQGRYAQGYNLGSVDNPGNTIEDLLIRRECLPQATSEITLALNLRYDPDAVETIPISDGELLLNDGLSGANEDLWEMADGWGNGGIFANEWSADQITFVDNRMTITLEDAGSGLVSGEYRSLESYGYGRYEARIKASDVPGTIAGFFTYSEAPHDEIDIEIKGDDPSKMQVNYWSDGEEHPVVIDLGFDASQDFHTYAFEWEPEGIKWFVDGVEVHVEDGSNGALPSNPGQLMLNLWASEGAGEWSSDFSSIDPVSIEVDSISHTAFATAETGDPQSLYAAWDGTQQPPLPESAYDYWTKLQCHDDQGESFDVSVYFDYTSEANEREFIVTHDPALDRRLIDSDGARYNDGDSPETGAGALLYGKLIFNSVGELLDIQAWQVPPNGDLLPTVGNMLARDPRSGFYSFEYNLSGIGPNLSSTLNFGAIATPRIARSQGLAKADGSGESASAVDVLTSWDSVYDIAGNRAQNGDEISFNGLKGSGEAVALTYVVDYRNRVEDLMVQLEEAFSCTALIRGGRLELHDLATGASQLTITDISYRDANGDSPMENSALAQLFGDEGSSFVVEPNEEMGFSPIRTTNYASQSSDVFKGQNGYGTGILQDISVAADGTVTGHYSNNQSLAQARVALADFADYKGLALYGGNIYKATEEAGAPVIGVAGSGTFGNVHGNSLEISNVDLARQFVDLTMTQRIFQANSMILTTANEVYETALRLKQ